MKQCRFCREDKPLDDFYGSAKAKGGKRHLCKLCDNRAKQISVYGMTLQDHKDMLDNQSGCCKLCGVAVGVKKFDHAVDHCHYTGRVRGILCRLCNLGIGYFRDKPELLVAAQAYLSEYHINTV